MHLLVVYNIEMDFDSFRNTFLFLGNDVTSVYDLLREVCHEADVQHPERINSATSRAYISTLTQVHFCCTYLYISIERSRMSI